MMNEAQVLKPLHDSKFAATYPVHLVMLPYPPGPPLIQEIQVLPAPMKMFHQPSAETLTAERLQHFKIHYEEGFNVFNDIDYVK